MNKEYIAFLESKKIAASEQGLSAVPPLSDKLFPYQKHCVEFLLSIGSGGLFLDTGLGKTLCELEWSIHASQASNGKALILAPLAVTWQIEREGKRFGYPVKVIRDQSEADEGINICNYERLDKIDPSAFGAVTLDESSILKSFTGKTTRHLIEAFAGHRWRLAATATPAPNDHMEVGNHAEFLGLMSSMEMLSRFFINDTSTASQKWRLKSHAEAAFYDWMASWSRMASLPSDLGDRDEGFILPSLDVIRHRDRAAPIVKGDGLFGALEISATSMHKVKRETADWRAVQASILALSNTEPWVLWVDTDYEADAVKALLPESIEVKGSMSLEKKEENLKAFADGAGRILVTKPSICGFGLNWQHCCHTAFVGRSFSYEAWYQAVRRFWRFGQKRNVEVHIIVAEGEDAIGRVIDRKADQHDKMKKQMRLAMTRSVGARAETKIDYQPNHEGSLPAWLCKRSAA